MSKIRENNKGKWKRGGDAEDGYFERGNNAEQRISLSGHQTRLTKSMAQFHQAAQEGLCLRYPDGLPAQREITYENAVNLLLRGTAMAANVPFSWSYIDKPSGSSTLCIEYTWRRRILILDFPRLRWHDLPLIPPYELALSD